MNTMQRRLDNVVNAIENRVWLDTQYQSRDDKGNTVTIARQILPFKLYKSREGRLVVDGFDTYRGSVRTFRLDRFKRLARGEQHQGEDPSVLRTRGGEGAGVGPGDWRRVRPAHARGRDHGLPGAAWGLVQARPQTISPKALDRFLASGWATQPFAGVIEPEVH